MDYQVNIRMTADTLNRLNASRFQLYGFLAVQCSDPAGLPLIWLKTSDYSASTFVRWSNAWGAFTSLEDVTAGKVLDCAFDAPIAAGQTLNVAASGVGTVVNGEQGLISVNNLTQDQFACGLEAMVGGRGGVMAPFCGFPLYGGSVEVFVPQPQILLAFSHVPFAPGMAVQSVSGSGVLISMDEQSSRQVSYDINKGWSWDGGVWAQSVAANALIAPLLIQSSDSLARLAKR